MTYSSAADCSAYYYYSREQSLPWPNRTDFEQNLFGYHIY